jgi:hypothetical protein
MRAFELELDSGTVKVSRAKGGNVSLVVCQGVTNLRFNFRSRQAIEFSNEMRNCAVGSGTPRPAPFDGTEVVCKTAREWLTKIQDFARELPGAQFSVCDDSWSRILGFMCEDPRVKWCISLTLFKSTKVHIDDLTVDLLATPYGRQQIADNFTQGRKIRI